MDRLEDQAGHNGMIKMRRTLVYRKKAESFLAILKHWFVVDLNRSN